MARLDGPAAELQIPVAKGARASDLLGVLDRARAEDPAEPFWKGVRRLSATNGYVEIEWHDPVEPRLLPAGDVEVECHLYDEESLRKAEEYRETADQSRSRIRDS